MNPPATAGSTESDESNPPPRVNILLGSWPQAHDFGSHRRSISADTIAPAALGPIKRGVGHFHQLNGIARVFRICRDADADRHAVHTRRFTTPPSHGGEFLLLDGRSDAFGRNQSLRVISIQQKRGE